MKKLTELGISPAPWKKAVNNFGMGENIIWDANNYLVQYSGIDSNNCAMENANHSMLVAAPKLYGALYDLITIARNRMPSKPTIEEIEALRNAEAALAEAAGESEVNK